MAKVPAGCALVIGLHSSLYLKLSGSLTRAGIDLRHYCAQRSIRRKFAIGVLVVYKKVVLSFEVE